MCLCFEGKQPTEITEFRLLLPARQSTEHRLDAMICLISASLFSLYLLLFLIMFFICGSHTSRQCEGNALNFPLLYLQREHEPTLTVSYKNMLG